MFINANFPLDFLQPSPDLLHDHAAQHDVLGVHSQPGLGLQGEDDQDQGAAGDSLPGEQEQARVTTGHLEKTIIWALGVTLMDYLEDIGRLIDPLSDCLHI